MEKKEEIIKKEIKKQTWKPGNMLYPLPAIMVSCARPGEKPNIITLAWAGTVCSDPVMVSISVRKERYSYDILKETGEFVINLTTDKLAYATDFCGVRSGRELDKFKEMKVTAGKASKVSCPVISESPVNLECKIVNTLELGSHTMFIAEVVAVDVSEEYIDENGRFNLNSTGLMTYSHGEYFTLGKKLGKFGYSVKKEKTREMKAKPATPNGRQKGSEKTAKTKPEVKTGKQKSTEKNGQRKSAEKEGRKR